MGRLLKHNVVEGIKMADIIRFNNTHKDSELVEADGGLIESTDGILIYSNHHSCPLVFMRFSRRGPSCSFNVRRPSLRRPPLAFDGRWEFHYNTWGYVLLLVVFQTCSFIVINNIMRRVFSKTWRISMLFLRRFAFFDCRLPPPSCRGCVTGSS